MPRNIEIKARIESVEALLPQACKKACLGADSPAAIVGPRAAGRVRGSCCRAGAAPRPCRSA